MSSDEDIRKACEELEKDCEKDFKEYCEKVKRLIKKDSKIGKTQILVEISMEDIKNLTEFLIHVVIKKEKIAEREYLETWEKTTSDPESLLMDV